MSNQWSGKTVVVTGATGFIGSSLVEELVRRGAQVRVLVRPRTPAAHERLGNLSPQVLSQIQVCQGNVLEPEGLRAAVNDAHLLFHLAALISIPYSYEHPREVFEVNAIGTLNALIAARQERLERVVIVSSSEVYGTARYSPIDEGHPLQAQSPYAASKVAAEKLAESFFRSFGLPVTIVRPFNTFGPRQSLRAVIPTIVAQALFSKTIKLGTLSTWRDFTFVADTVDGLLAVAQPETLVGEVVNLGTGRTVTIAEVVDRVKALTDSAALVVQDDVRRRPPQSEVERLCAGIEKAKRNANWHPQTSLEEGLRATIDWLRGAIEPDEATRYHY